MTPTPRAARRWSPPRARTDLFFRRAGSGWDLASRDGLERHSLAFREAVLWTYCDGRHDLRELTAAVESLAEDTEPDLTSWIAATLTRLRERDLIS